VRRKRRAKIRAPRAMENRAARGRRDDLCRTTRTPTRSARADDRVRW
jgi:hypothetical protein